MKRLNRWVIAMVSFMLALVCLVGEGFAQQGEPLVISLADADMTLVGEDDGDWAAYFASPAGDVNGDGLGDALIGAPMAGNKVCPVPQDPCPPPYVPKGEGRAYLVLGRPQGEWPPNPVNLADADASFLGCEPESMTARQLYTAGDVNGDGYDDFLISGWKCGTRYTGKAYLILGRQAADWGTDFPVEQADASFLGENEYDFLSYYTSTAGDVNNDGYDDFLITSTHYDISSTQLITDTGKVYLILGRQAADWGTDYPAAQADASFLGEAEGDRIGRSATGVGDVNGDGYDDFLIGSVKSDYGGEDAGQNYLFLGRAREGEPGYDPAQPWWGANYPVAQADASFVGEAAKDESGRRVARAGDVNDDGLSDFLIGAGQKMTAGQPPGIAYLILGQPLADWGMRYSLAGADASFVGEESRDQAGRRVSGAGDVNNDGYDDFLIGAPQNARGGELAGTTYLIYGRNLADWGPYYSLEQADVLYVGKPDVGVAGYDVAWLGDFDGDSIDDFLIGAYGGRNNNEVPGEAYVILGSASPVPLEFTPDAPAGALMGWYTFTGEYWDPNGWDDIARVQLILGRHEGDLKGLNVIYNHNYDPAVPDGLYLLKRDGSTWLGPCSPGEVIKLGNGVVQLDCMNSSIDHDAPGRIQVSWTARWVKPPNSGDLNVYLRAVDHLRNDSGFVEFGAWPLVMTKTYIPLVIG
ncbi:MAG: hypothetical protein GTO49_07500 [Anaerolineae bacterium]|nr:hypothetical protein [Anaerolineae bacterium]